MGEPRPASAGRGFAHAWGRCVACGATGVPGAAVCLGRAAWCARGRRPARSPSAPRAFGSVRRLEARPGPAAAHGHRSQVLRSLRRPPHRPRLRGCVSPRSPARPRRRPRAPQPGPPAPSTPVGPVLLRTIRLVSRPALALPPPTSTAAWPRHRPRVPWQVPRPLWHRGQARRSLRRSPVVCVFWIGSSVVDRNGASG